MNQTEKRMRTLETAMGMTDDTSFCAQVARMHARGETIPVVTVEPGESEEKARAREGIRVTSCLAPRKRKGAKRKVDVLLRKFAVNRWAKFLREML